MNLLIDVASNLPTCRQGPKFRWDDFMTDESSSRQAQFDFQWLALNSRSQNAIAGDEFHYVDHWWFQLFLRSNNNLFQFQQTVYGGKLMSGSLVTSNTTRSI